MMKKKIIAMLLAAVLILSVVVVPAPTAAAAGEYTAKLSNANGDSVIVVEPGQTVTLTLSLENNPGFLGFGATLNLPEGVSLTAAPAFDLIKFVMETGTAPQTTTSPDLTSNPYRMLVTFGTGTAANKLVKMQGAIATVTVKIADNAAAGDYPIALNLLASENFYAEVDASEKIIPGSFLYFDSAMQAVGCTLRIEPPCAHEWGQWTDKPGYEADCDTPGKQIRECGLCHEIEEKDVSAKGHSFTTYTETTPATCITNAKETATCDYGCGETDEREVANSATPDQHSFQGQPYIPNNDATCTANGTQYRVCAVPGCGAKETAVEIPNSKLDHAYTGTDLTYPATEANCHAAATYYYVCVNGCNGQGTTTFPYGSVNANNHDGDTERRNAEPATEEAPGYTGDLYCLGCNTMIEEGEPIDQLDHTHAMQKTAAHGKTCTEPGNIEYYTCTKCHKIYNDEQGTTELQLADTVIPASHELTKTQANPNSCTEPGNIEYYTCSVCTKKFSDAAGTNEVTNVVIPAAGHDMTKTGAAAPDCVNSGNYEYYTCNTCHKLFEDVNGNTETNETAVFRPATGHDMNHVLARGKTCTTNGNIEHYECNTCHKLYADQQGTTELQPADVTILASHELTLVPAEPNSCTEPGNVKHYHCSVCLKNFSDEAGTNELATVVVPAAGHDMTRTGAAAPDCVNSGNYEYYTCQTCHKLFEDVNGNTETNETAVFRPATGHDMQKTEAQPNGCTQPGNIEYYTCLTCNKLYKDAQGVEQIQQQDTVIPAAHKLDKTVKNPATCTEPGNIEYYTCSVCQKLYKEAEATNEITLAETVIAALGHQIGKVEAKPADCTEQGNIEHYACSNGCGELYADAAGTQKLEAKDVFQDALGHDLIEHKAVAATVEAEGNILHYECKTCKKLFAEDKKTVIEEKDTVIPKLPKPESATPAAGDTFDVSLCVAVMLLACLCLALTVVIRKKTTR